MARQRAEDNLLYLIFRRMPTWATAATVAASYVVLRYLLPLLMHRSPWALIGAAYAPWITFVIAVIALFAEGDKYQRRKLLEKQTGLDTIRQMSWREFELLVGEVYRQQGYRVEETGGSGPDGGVDLILRRNGETVLVQCKRWKESSKVGAPAVRQLLGAVMRDRATRGIFVTCSGFTAEAIAEMRGQPIELVDGAALLELVKQAQGQTAPAQAAPLQEMPPPVKDTPAAPPLCPKCGEPMQKRTARSGANSGSQFWGCPAFPRCRGVRDF
jgi:restriction system protein